MTNRPLSDQPLSHRVLSHREDSVAYSPELVAGNSLASIFSPKTLPSELFFSLAFFKPSRIFFLASSGLALTQSFLKSSFLRNSRNGFAVFVASLFLVLVLFDVADVAVGFGHGFVPHGVFAFVGELSLELLAELGDRAGRRREYHGAGKDHQGTEQYRQTFHSNFS